MLVYHFLDAKFGLKDLRESRLKISEVAKLNDPFEFIAPETVTAEQRTILQEFKKEFFIDKGLVCFSRDWQNPVQWSHYADRHRGLCLGFNIPSGNLMQVSYVASRFPWPEKPWPWSRDEGMHFMTKLLVTKFAHWSYEDEYRFFTSRKTVDSEGISYLPFSDQLNLTEVLIGARSDLSKKDITEALGESASNVKVSRVRESFKSFEVVKIEDNEA